MDYATSNTKLGILGQAPQYVQTIMTSKYETFPLSSIICTSLTVLFLIILIVFNIQTYLLLRQDAKIKRLTAQSNNNYKNHPTNNTHLNNKEIHKIKNKSADDFKLYIPKRQTSHTIIEMPQRHTSSRQTLKPWERVSQAARQSRVVASVNYVDILAQYSK